MKMDSLEKYKNGFVAKNIDIKLWDPVAKQDVKLMGQKFGRLVVTGAVHLNGDVQYICKCECGRAANASAEELEKGQKIDCGCALFKDMGDKELQRALKAKRKVIDRRVTREKQKQNDNEMLLRHVGERHGSLVVRALAGRSRKGNTLLVSCECDCGKETVKRYSNLSSGRTKSCGCLRQKGKIDIEPWKQYGNMSTIKEAPKGTSRHVKWMCECIICGEEIIVRASVLKKLVSSKTCNCAKHKERVKRQKMRRKKELAKVAYQKEELLVTNKELVPEKEELAAKREKEVFEEIPAIEELAVGNKIEVSKNDFNEATEWFDGL